MSEKNEDVELVFLPSPRVHEGLQKVGTAKEAQKFVAKVEDIVKWFKKYKVDSIELYVEGAFSS